MPIGKRINSRDFLRMFNCQRPDLPQVRLKGMNTYYRAPRPEELEEYLLDVLKKIDSLRGRARTREENLEAFEKGWRGNLETIKSDGLTENSLKPGYFRPSKFLRYDKRLVVTRNHNLEYDLFTVARHILFKKFLSSFNTIYELGCGSCQNLLLLSDLYPQKELYGLDWTDASLEIAGFLSKALGKNIKGYLFDMLNPSSDTAIKPGSAIISIHALEQVGTEHRKLLDFILKCRPGIVLHYEPVLEFYDENNLLDYLALVYSQKRNYLSGYFTLLQSLKEQGKIEIMEARRPYLGGIIHEASLVVWRPL